MKLKTLLMLVAIMLFSNVYTQVGNEVPNANILTTSEINILTTGQVDVTAVASLIDNAIVHYTFDETSDSLVYDYSGNSNDGIANSSSCWEPYGRFNEAFHFSGSEKIDMPAKDIMLTSEEGTVAFWVLLPESSTNSINCIWWAGERDGDMFGPHNEMHVHTEGAASDVWAGGEVSFFIQDSIEGSYDFIYSDPWKGFITNSPSENVLTLTDSVWHHVACTWELGSYLALYIDGEIIWDTTAYSLQNVYDLDIMTLGLANQRTSRGLKGNLDEFLLFDYALSAAEILNVYEYIPDGSTVSKSNDATLADLKVDGSTISGFFRTNYSYTYVVDKSITTLPVVTTTKNNANAEEPVIDTALSIPGTTTITVTAENGITVRTYSVYFRYAGTDASLADIKVNDAVIPGFSGSTYTYDYLLEPGVSMPIVTATPADENAYELFIQSSSAVPGKSTIKVVAEDGITTQVYVVNFSYKIISSDATLSNLKVNGMTIADFYDSVFTYNYYLEQGALVPIVTATKADANASEPIINSSTSIPGISTITVVAEDGTTNIYVIYFDYKSAFEKQSIKDMEFYPNPAKYAISFNNTMNIETIGIFGLTGVKIMVQPVETTNNVVEININNLSSGFYFIRAFIENDLVAVGKFLKE